MKVAIKMNTEEKERIKELRLKGMGYKAIASITGSSRDIETLSIENVLIWCKDI